MSFNSDEVEQGRIKVLIVDDHTLFAKGTVSLLSLEPHILVVGIAKSGIECMKQISELTPDVVLLDIDLPDTCGTELIERIILVYPEVKILMLTGQSPKGYVTESINKGANGFLLKDCSIKEIIDGIVKVYEGGVYFSHSIENFLEAENRSQNEQNQVKDKKISKEVLTPRETTIIELVSRGLHNKEIAMDLGINVRTVDFHVSNILVKLGVNKRMEAVLKWAYVDKKDRIDGK